jgi:hypothetical protein
MPSFTPHMPTDGRNIVRTPGKSWQCSNFIIFHLPRSMGVNGSSRRPAGVFVATSRRFLSPLQASNRTRTRCMVQCCTPFPISTFNHRTRVFNYGEHSHHNSELYELSPTVLTPEWIHDTVWLLPPFFRVARAELMTQYESVISACLMNTFLEGDHFEYNEAGVLEFGRASHSPPSRFPDCTDL